MNLKSMTQLDIDALCDKALAGREMIRLYPKA